jgi:hypothetical protein
MPLGGCLLTPEYEMCLSFKGALLLEYGIYLQFEGFAEGYM